MRRFKCVVQYDGTNYIGWQSQLQNNSVQEAIEKVINRISNENINIVAAGRTDAKVHALGQVFHFDTEFYLDDWQWHKAINGYLPKDIYINSIEEVDKNFHARFSAKKKRYDYLINLGPYNTLLANYTYQSKYDLDLKKMEEASKIFIGTHDFTTFCSNSLEIHPNQVREIFDITFSKEDNILRITYTGKGFLRYMVRMLTASLIEVARGRLTIEELSAMLEAKDKEACKNNAEPQGLYLVSIDY